MLENRLEVDRSALSIPQAQTPKPPRTPNLVSTDNPKPWVLPPNP